MEGQRLGWAGKDAGTDDSPVDEPGLDDWLAEQGELDWDHDPRGEEPTVEPLQQGYPQRSRSERPPARGAGRPGREPVRAGPKIERQRRIIALVALGLLVVGVVVGVVVTSSGGSSDSSELTPTVPQTTPPATTPPRTQPTTTEQSTTPTKPPVRVTVPSGGTLSTGDNGAAVVALQKALTSLGYDTGTPDGDFGPTTEAAVIAFQKANGLAPDGIIGTETAQALNQALASGTP